jgi:hypothetical protein
MAVTLKLADRDADLIMRVLGAIPGHDDKEVGRLLSRAEINALVHGDALQTLARVASYIETVVKAG